ncbi:MAG: hypothetical protein V2A34_02545 [Lentisphaerota bacterium]
MKAADFSDKSCVEISNTIIKALLCDDKFIRESKQTQLFLFTEKFRNSGFDSDGMDYDHASAVIKVNIGLKRGFERYQQSISPEVLLVFPCLELSDYGRINAENNDELKCRWDISGGHVYEKGRRIAFTTDPIWFRLSTYSRPYPPFNISNNNYLRPISCTEAEAFGFDASVIQKSVDISTIVPPFIGFDHKSMKWFIEASYECEKCGQRFREDQTDCCAECGAIMCLPCMKLGCCGKMPALSGL